MTRLHDRNIRIARDHRRINKRVRVRRARGARGRIRLSRLTPPKRPDFQPAKEQGSAARNTALSRPVPMTGWTLQIGTFSRVGLAELAGKRARDVLPGLLSRSNLVVQPITTPGKTLYRALYVGLERDAALSACARLEATGRTCLARRPDRSPRAPSTASRPPIN